MCSEQREDCQRPLYTRYSSLARTYLHVVSYFVVERISRCCDLRDPQDDKWRISSIGTHELTCFLLFLSSPPGNRLRFHDIQVQAEELFEAAIAANPAHAESLGNLAVLLHGQPCASAAVLDKIETLYKRAVHADPVNANNLSNFGLFLAEVIFL